MYQLIITPASNAWISSVKKILTAKSGDKDSPSPTLDPGHKEGLEKKILFPGFYSTVRILSISDDEFRAQVNLDNTLSAFNQFNDPKNNNLVKRIFTTSSAVIKRIVLRELNTFDLHLPLIHLKFYCNNMLLNCAELSNLFHFGNKLIPVPGIKKISFKKSAAPGNVLPEGVVMGVNKFRDISTVIRIGDEDRLRHTYILGQTGTGKSVFLFSQALQDIYRGEGVCILDPHGKDIDEMLAKIPKHREKDVIYFKASDVERPFGFNVLEADNDYQRNTIINYFIELLNKMYDPNNQGITGPQFQQAVRSSMATCMVDPEATLIDVVELIRDPEKAEKYLPKVTDPDVISYWRNQIANTTAQTRSETLGYFTSKFTKFQQKINSVTTLEQLFDEMILYSSYVFNDITYPPDCLNSCSGDDSPYSKFAIGLFENTSYLKLFLIKITNENLNDTLFIVSEFMFFFASNSSSILGSPCTISSVFRFLCKLWKMTLFFLIKSLFLQ
jgi:hypothetical protein